MHIRLPLNGTFDPIENTLKCVVKASASLSTDVVPDVAYKTSMRLKSDGACLTLSVIPAMKTWTYEFWAYMLTNNPTAYQQITRHSAPSQQGIQVSPTTLNLDGNNKLVVATAGLRTVMTKSWTHFAVVNDGTSARVYQDGTKLVDIAATKIVLV
ncbi:hypothetical protein JKP88DRAFT_256296 [Tribonema minus]|uniref:Uncharacterized protein n=1 Tax=Tribonema minus TaxID=303371 RepID=A0A835YP47_9STRA|nr:hypothetical protein JKP88DRAFT_256296 [Tribonema minus]